MVADTPSEETVNAPESSEKELRTDDADLSVDSSVVVPGVGDRISVFWPLENQSFDSTVHSEAEEGRLNIHYDDGDEECLDISQEKWKFANALAASSSALPEQLCVTSKGGDVLSSVVDHFGNKPFLKHHAQGFDQYPLFNAYKLEEETFLKTVRPVPNY